MSDILLFLILGLGSGALYAGVGLGAVLTYRSSGVVNFAYGAIAMIPAYIYGELRANGALVLPIPGLPRMYLTSGAGTGLAPAMAIALAFAIILGALMHYLVFRPLRTATVVAKVVASVGVLLVLQSVAVLCYGQDAVVVANILPAGPVTFLGAAVPRDRFYLAAIVVLLGAALAVVYKFTRFGIATRAAAEKELGAAFLGLRADGLAAINIIAASLLAGVLGILVASITVLDPTTYSEMIIPALAAALVARFTSFGVTVAAALVLGMLQSEVLHLQAIWSWLPQIGTQEALPFVIIVVTMVLAGSKLPTRATLVDRRLPLAIRSRRPWAHGGAAAVAGVVLAFALPNAYRYAYATSLIGALVCLSLVVLTGYLGQISLAQMAFAGAAAFALPKLALALHVPFFIAAIPAVLLATVLGAIAGLPALRVRGVNLAVVTLALGVTVSSFVFANQRYTGGYNGLAVPEPNLFGLKLGSAGDQRFTVLCLVVVILAAMAVSWLRRSRLGLQMLAVRANERAAAAVGIDVRRVKLIGFSISAGLAGLAGVLLAAQQVTITFTSFDVFVSLGFLASAFLGGIASVGGSLLGGMLAAGGLVFYCLQQWSGLGQYEVLISGLALVFNAVVAPEGIVGGLVLLGDALRLGRGKTSPASGAPTQLTAPAGRYTEDDAEVGAS